MPFRFTLSAIDPALLCLTLLLPLIAEARIHGSASEVRASKRALPSAGEKGGKGKKKTRFQLNLNPKPPSPVFHRH